MGRRAITEDGCSVGAGRRRGRARIEALAWTLLLGGGCYQGVGLEALEQTAGAGADAGPDGGSSGETDPEQVDVRDPGRVTLHRLNRAEYNNTIRDLFYGLEGSPADAFPADDAAIGFDNIASALSLSPRLFRLYEEAAEETLARALADAPEGGEPDVRGQLLACEPSPISEDACSREIVQRFAERAWRRPLTDAELDRLVALVGEATAQGGAWEDGIALALKAALVSPYFIYRVELDPDPSSTAPHPLSDWELASRLSYFVWSSMPDDQLFERARRGGLNEPEAIEAEVRRMLASPKARALVDNFAAQWLYVRDINEFLTKDEEVYPGWDPELRDAMRTELELLAETFLTEDRSLRELLTAKETFVNDRLAEFYGLPPVEGDGFVRVSLEGHPRKGLLTTAGLMSVLSHSNASSPVKRGVWILDQLLCSAPPPPPPGIDVTPLEPSTEDGPVRERLARHREDPQCAACHSLMDSIGLSLEHYDATGAWRETEGPWPIDASGEMPSPLSGTFEDALGMVEYIARSDRFARCAAEKAFVYGLGRGSTTADTEFVDEITASFVDRDMALRELVVAVTTSDAFRHRRGEAPEQEEE